MTNAPVFSFEELADADLVIDAIYKGGHTGNVSDDPLARLLPVGNQGGFRYKVVDGRVTLVVLYTTGGELDWPDRLDPELGELTYFGDNRHPGSELHDTSRGGNRLLRDHFTWTYGTEDDRKRVPPYLLFEKFGSGRDVRFRGLLVPGSVRLRQSESLVAVWRHIAGSRFQNYRATFTLIAAPVVSREWIREVLAGDALGAHCPPEWLNWVQSAHRSVLRAEPTRVIRTREEQLPTVDRLGPLHEITEFFREWPQGFEACAVDLWRMFAPATGVIDLTRPWRDGGRDAVGEYLLGPVSDRVVVEFALEAKCYGAQNSVGVREMSRLIARLRYRQFGVFVTTSYFARQAYEEVRADAHPVVLICGRDIVDILEQNHVSSPSEVRSWLRANYSQSP
jgi:hypothetical protein